MKFTEIVSPSLTDLFVGQMERHIISGQLKPGEKLPTERALAEEMNVSLAVVNGGIRRLAEMGLLRIVPRKGVFVADYIRNGNVDTLRAILEYGGGCSQSELISALTEFRRCFEEKSVRVAALKRTEENLQNMIDLRDKFMQVNNPIRLSDLVYEFHHEMAIASGKVVLALVVATFKPIYTTSYRTIFDIYGKEGTVERMNRAIECFQKKDEEGAAAIIRQSIDEWDRCVHTHFSGAAQE